MAGRGKKSAVYGELVTTRGDGAPVDVLPPSAFGAKAGYEPQVLDPYIKSLIDNADRGSQLIQNYTPILAALMERLKTEVDVLLETMPHTVVPGADSEVAAPAMSEALQIMLDLAEKASVIFDRLSKMNVNATKSADDATRLRHFLAGGEDDDDSGLKNLGENQLRKLVTDAAQGFMKANG